MATQIKKPTGKISITPKDLLGDEIFAAIEHFLLAHLRNTDNECEAGQYPALIFGRQPGGTVTKIYFAGEV